MCDFNDDHIDPNASSFSEEEKHYLSKIILPNYYSSLLMAQHDLYCALEKMRHTPVVTKEQFGEVTGIFISLQDYMDKLIKTEINRDKQSKNK